MRPVIEATITLRAIAPPIASVQPLKLEARTFAKTKMKALATTWEKLKTMKALRQPQNNHSILCAMN
jgi:hypothetical protein